MNHGDSGSTGYPPRGRNREDGMNQLRTGVAAAFAITGSVSAQDLPGKFEGVTIDANLIGGQ